MKLVATTAFGLEAICKRELIALGFDDLYVEDGAVAFEADVKGLVRANIWLRTADRVLIELASFSANEFEDLYQGALGVRWEDYIRPDDAFIVSGKSVKSKLHSVPACQSVTERAIIDRLSRVYKKTTRFEKSGARVKIEVALTKDVAKLFIDTSGVGLHKRGYRGRAGDAPIKETLASAMIMLSYWNENRILHDMFCGSGTIPIEAAMIGRNIAPGLFRKFDFEGFKFVESQDTASIRKAARDMINRSVRLNILGSDIDHKSVLRARDNAALFKLDRDITFFIKDFRDLDLKDDYSVIITNPPYGERMGELSAVEDLYRDLSYKLEPYPTYSWYIISSLENLEKLMRRKADRKRKLYNGTIKVDYYQFYGPKPEILR